MTEPSAMVALILFCAALVRSTFGFGDALLAMPLLLLLMPITTAAPLVSLLSVVMALAMLYTGWQAIHWASLWPFLVTALATLPIGFFLLREVNGRWLTLLLGALLIGFGAYRARRLVLPELNHPGITLVLGLMAGILGGAYNTHGPPIVLYGSVRRWSPAQFRANLQAYFLITYAAIFAGHAMNGLLTPPVWRHFVWALPAVLGAIFLGQIIATRLSVTRFEQLLNVLLILLGATLLFS